MLSKSIRIFKLLGFEVKIDLSWLILVVLISWSLAQSLFPHLYKNLETSTYWWMGIAGAFGLFLSIVIHEFSHSLVARHFGIPMRGITLFIFGGVAEMTEEPQSAKSELLMAIAGPAASIVIGGIFQGARFLGENANWPTSVIGVVAYLGLINFVLAGFNLLPAFPLDGGRVLRAILWSIKKNIRKATLISSRIGSGFGMLLIVLGGFNVLAGNVVGGIWWFLIGMFIRHASQMSYQQLLFRRELKGEPVDEFMQKNPVTVPLSITLDELWEDYIQEYHFKLFPVVDNDKLYGCLDIRKMKQIPRKNWDEHTVKEIADQCSEENTIESGTDAVKALNRMRQSKENRYMVVKNGKLVGMIALSDLMDFLSTKIDLKEGE